MNKKLTKIKSSFKDNSLFERAFTHKSWVNENMGKERSNERLEFLGDAVLEFVVSSHLYQTLSDKEEGFLTNLRANIVNTTNLSVVAADLALGKELKLSRGELAAGGQENPSLLANTVESLIGAIYIDQGFDSAKQFIHDYILYDIDIKLSQPLKDAKSRLQETVQAKGFPAPKYKVIKEEGPDHDKTFEVQVNIDGKPHSVGVGKSKSIAEQAAAAVALESFEVVD